MQEQNEAVPVNPFVQINKNDFNPVSMDDALRVDRLCQKLLRGFYDSLLLSGATPQVATELANSADYYVRDFVVDFKSENLFAERCGLIKQFAGNWYIISTIEPKISQLAQHLQGIAAFFRFLHEQRLISISCLKQLEKECADLNYYEQRIEAFWNISDGGYAEWENECSLKK